MANDKWDRYVGQTWPAWEKVHYPIELANEDPKMANLSTLETDYCTVIWGRGGALVVTGYSSPGCMRVAVLDNKKFAESCRLREEGLRLSLCRSLLGREAMELVWKYANWEAEHNARDPDLKFLNLIVNDLEKGPLKWLR